MSEHRPTGARATADAARYRRRVRELEATLVAFQVEALRAWLSDRMADFDDFERFIGRENVIDEVGRIDYRELQLRVGVLLERKPHLAARVAPADVGDRV